MRLWLHVCFKQFVDLNHCVTEEHYYLRQNAMSTVGFYPQFLSTITIWVQM
jgi:hypothetical protein